MLAKERRDGIIKFLYEKNEPLKGALFASYFEVTRQVIVKDIAILRAEGYDIIATPDGYLLRKNNPNNIKKIIAVNHNVEDIYDELEIVVKYGGIIEDVIVEHPLYGEIKGMIMIKTLNDLIKFKEKCINSNAKPLSLLTGGIHNHTISTPNEESMRDILTELKGRGFLIY
ncbi:hypothetical protein SAMN02745163_04540 [Clostridium cavendishii DSM 21758]|uniref:Transcriptional regulator n=1 Tax=Clostridium cavendishii DSM 21758 TaxID=1121302 RepID=A0A1M6VP79_9CLOT|nr:transcription repressor NadR [Clostridium cavendishii]SHK83303.1 hypothetical protein SAMN02745163_04540 [Clostridium cavendishii DSM 21758]